MDTYDKTKIGKLISWGGEHLVYNYDKEKVIKFSLIYFILGSKAQEKAHRDRSLCQKFFGKYFLETEFAISSNRKHLVHIQPKVLGHFLGIKDLQQEKVRCQFKEIADAHEALIKAGHAPVDLMGRGGIFHRCLSNIFVTKNHDLLIIDATLIEFSGSMFLKPFVFILHKIGLPIQQKTMDIFLSIVRKSQV